MLIHVSPPSHIEIVVQVVESLHVVVQPRHVIVKCRHVTVKCRHVATSPDMSQLQHNVKLCYRLVDEPRDGCKSLPCCCLGSKADVIFFMLYVHILVYK